MSIKFSVPYNNDFAIFERFKELNKTGKNKIEEIYFSGPQEYSGSGRVVQKTEMADTIKIIKCSKELGIKSNLVLNATCGGADWYASYKVSKILKMVSILYEAGLNSVTVANPLYIRKINKEFPEIKIVASVLSKVDVSQKAEIIENLGASVICPDRDINRDFKKLEAIRNSTKAEIKLLVNEGCLFSCPFRPFHFNLISHYSEANITPKDRFFFNCQHIVLKDPSQILKSSWINPENLKKYDKITRFFKISGRTKTSDWIIKSTKAYLDEVFEGNLLDIMDSNLDYVKANFGYSIGNTELEKIGFFEKVLQCNNNCAYCDYCKETASRLLKKDGATQRK